MFEEALLIKFVHALLKEQTRVLVGVNTETELGFTLGEQFLVRYEVFLCEHRLLIDCVLREDPSIVDHDEVDDLLPHSHDRVLDQSIIFARRPV